MTWFPKSCLTGMLTNDFFNIILQIILRGLMTQVIRY